MKKTILIDKEVKGMYEEIKKNLNNWNKSKVTYKDFNIQRDSIKNKYDLDNSTLLRIESLLDKNIIIYQ